MTPDRKRMYKLMAGVFAAAGQEVRLAILDFLRDGEQCVCDIAENVGANRSNVSRHLAVMRNAGLVSQRKEGLKVIYALRTPCILTMMQCVEGVLRNRAEEASEVLETLK